MKKKINVTLKIKMWHLFWDSDSVDWWAMDDNDNNDDNDINSVGDNNNVKSDDVIGDDDDHSDIGGGIKW